jgi:GTPase SAR1 family protein
MAFVRGIVRQGLENTTMPLFFLGETCSGKTSLINAMCSKNGKSPAISKHMRTIGVDVVPWQALENLKFTVFDVGGMDLYKSTSQQFLSRRAMYVVVWSASDDPDNWERGLQGVRNTLESLQIRIPGATFLLVVTHVDMCNQQSLDKQVNPKP